MADLWTCGRLGSFCSLFCKENFRSKVIDIGFSYDCYLGIHDKDLFEKIREGDYDMPSHISNEA